MESIREIVVAENNRIELIVPDNFIGKEVEVFAIKIDKEFHQSKKNMCLMQSN